MNGHRRSAALVLLTSCVSASLALGTEGGAVRDVRALPPPSPELLRPQPRSALPSPLHPAVILRDASGAAVATSGLPLSAPQTCGQCHDASHIASHGRHFSLGSNETGAPGQSPSGRPFDFGPGVFGRWEPLSGWFPPAPTVPREPAAVDAWLKLHATRLVGGGPAQLAEQGRSLAPACVLCHVRGADFDAYAREVTAGHFSEAASAALSALGLLRLEKDGTSSELDVLPAAVTSQVRWRRAAFAVDGSLPQTLLRIEAPSSEVCGHCHGVAGDRGPSYASLTNNAGLSERSGQVFSSQRLRDSALNLAGREQQTRAWDVHAERLLNCSDCHSLPNDPSARRAATNGSPHLRVERRQLSFGEFLKRPDHGFERSAAQGGPSCRQCHEATSGHAFLPRAERHLQQIACETCHIPRSPAPARSVTDYTLPSASGGPRREWRGLDSAAGDASYISGSLPLWLRAKGDGEQLRPYQLSTTFYLSSLVSGVRQPVAQALLAKAALTDARDVRPELALILDQNHDGKVADSERWLSSKGAVDWLLIRLRSLGADSPRVEAELAANAVSHGVAPARDAIADCEACHGARSRLTASYPIARSAAPGSTPRLLADAPVQLDWAVVSDGGSGLEIRPSGAPRGLHVFGVSRWSPLDWVGLASVLGTLLAALAHGSLRWWSARRRRAS